MQQLFSTHESMLLKRLGRRKMSIQDLSDKFYGGVAQTDLAQRNYVAGITRRIKAKCEKKKLKWTLLDQGTGRGGKIIWRGKRARRKNAR